MPLYVDLLGYVTENVRTTEERRAVTSVLDDVDSHTDETLCAALQAALADHSAVVVWCLTVLDHGSVSVFDSDSPTATLHRVTAEEHEKSSIGFSWSGTGFADVEVSRVPESLLASHETFVDDLEPSGEPATLNFPTRFDDDAHLARVLDELTKVTTNDVRTFTSVGRAFVGVELGPGRSTVTPLVASGESSTATGVARRILAGEAQFSSNLVRQKAKWTFTEPAEAFEKSCREARSAISDSSWDENAKALRKELVEPIVAALEELAPNDPRRRELWDIASWLKSAKVRALTIKSIENGDPALDDMHIDRQRSLVFEDLPKRVADQIVRDRSLPWLPRVVRILAAYDLAKPEWPR